VKLQEFCENAVRRIKTPFGSKYGFDWTLLLTFLASLLENCNMSAEDMLKSTKRVGAIHMWRATRIANESCDACCNRRFSGDARAIVEAAAEQVQEVGDADVLREIIEEVRTLEANPGF
jgi:hypothetical protein